MTYFIDTSEEGEGEAEESEEEDQNEEQKTEEQLKQDRIDNYKVSFDDMIGRVVVDNMIQDNVYFKYKIEEDEAIAVLYANAPDL